MRRPIVIACLLLAVQAMLLVHTAIDKSDTWDEPGYVSEAANLWRHGDTGTIELLPKWGFGLAMRLSSDDITWAPFDPTTRAFTGMHVAHWESMTPEGRRRALLASRLVTILVTLLGGFFVWRTASRWGPLAGGIALAAWCFSPTVLANGCLATPDLWCAATLAGLLLAAVRAIERDGPARAAWFGAAMACAAATKHSVMPALPLALVVVVGARWRLGAPPRAIARDVVVTLVTAFFALWAIYRFSFGTFHVGTDRGIGPLPFYEWWGNLVRLSKRVDEGQPTYFMGETRWHGTRWFYVLAVAIKTTIGAQAMALLRLVLVGIRQPDRRTLRRELLIDLLLLLYPGYLFFTLSESQSQANIMYILPAFPFVLVWLARVAVAATRVFGRVGERIVVGLTALAAIESLSVHPHHLMFYNRWVGGPAHGWRYLVDREDWGQDKRRLGEWLRAHGRDDVYYQLYGLDAETWGVRVRPVPCRPTPGVYAIHASLLLIDKPVEWGGLPRACLDWLTIEPPDERLGWSIWIWRVDEARIARLTAAATGGAPRWRGRAPDPPGDDAARP